MRRSQIFLRSYVDPREYELKDAFAHWVYPHWDEDYGVRTAAIAAVTRAEKNECAGKPRKNGRKINAPAMLVTTIAALSRGKS